MNQEDKIQCIRAVESFYPGCAVEEFREQGQCSYTLLVSRSQGTSKSENRLGQNKQEGSFDGEEEASFMVQIRSEQYALDLQVTSTAKAVYPRLSPAVWVLELDLPGDFCAYEMEKIRGTPLARLLPKGSQAEPFPQKKYERLMESFAAFIAQGWHSTFKSLPKRNTRADSPMDDNSDMLSQCAGRVGSSIVARLEKLSDELPDEPLRQIAAGILRRLRMIEEYLVVLNHGDLIPSNVLVDEDTWEVTGVVDWAEAEYLPFGTCLYGLELLLGHLTPIPSSPTQSHDLAAAGTSPSFTYVENASGLRNAFWRCLIEAVPEIGSRQEDVRTMRDMGVLLWYGYAWDDGAINRVVNEADDPIEMASLRVFLNVA